MRGVTLFKEAQSPGGLVGHAPETKDEKGRRWSPSRRTWLVARVRVYAAVRSDPRIESRMIRVGSSDTDFTSEARD